MITGVALIGAGIAAFLVVGALLRTRLPRPASMALLVASGVAIGAGALLIQAHASAAEWAVTLLFLGAMAPFQARLIFGRFGRTRGVPSGTVGPD